MKRMKNKKLVARILCVITLVSVLTAAMIVPSLAWGYREDSGVYWSDSTYLTVNKEYDSQGYLIGYSVYTYNFTSFIENLYDRGQFDSSNDSLLNLNIVNIVDGKVVNMFPTVTLNLRQLYLAGQSISSFEYTNSTNVCHYGDNTYVIKTSISTVPDPDSVLGCAYTIGMTIRHPTSADLEDNSSWLAPFGENPKLWVRFSPTTDAYQSLVSQDYQELQYSYSDCLAENETLHDIVNEQSDDIESKQSTINDLNNTLQEQSTKIADLEETVATQESTIEDQKQTIIGKDEALANNNALFKLFDGIGSGISSIINTFADFSFAGVALGTVFAFVGIVIFVIIILKFVKR